MKYITSELEAWVTKMYRNIRIMDPDDLTIENICFSFQIFLRRHSAPSLCIVQGNYKMICLDDRLSSREQKEEFFHELAHILRHSGSQLNMPKPFVDLQEWDAHRFTLYAAVPIHMLHLFDLKDPYVIETMANRFGVTTNLCHERISKIRQKMLEMKRNKLIMPQINHQN